MIAGLRQLVRSRPRRRLLLHWQPSQIDEGSNLTELREPVQGAQDDLGRGTWFGIAGLPPGGGGLAAGADYLIGENVPPAALDRLNASELPGRSTFATSNNVLISSPVVLIVHRPGRWRYQSFGQSLG